MKTVFAKGDKVYTYTNGWGIIAEINPEDPHPVKVKFWHDEFDDDEGLIDYFTLEGKRYHYDHGAVLSFTEYDLVNGGFSQKRPDPKPIDLSKLNLPKVRAWDDNYDNYSIGWLLNISEKDDYKYKVLTENGLYTPNFKNVEEIEE